MTLDYKNIRQEDCCTPTNKHIQFGVQLEDVRENQIWQFLGNNICHETISLNCFQCHEDKVGDEEVLQRNAGQNADCLKIRQKKFE